MKAKELISLLGACDPESEVTIDVGRNSGYRELYTFIATKYQPEDGLACFENQYIYGARIESNACTLISEQQYFSACFLKEAKDQLINEEIRPKTNQGDNS